MTRLSRPRGAVHGGDGAEGERVELRDLLEHLEVPDDRGEGFFSSWETVAISWLL